MKAVRLIGYGTSDNLEFVEIPMPKISDNEILVKIKAAGVNHIDSLKASGLISHIYSLQMPWIPGADFAGEIEEIGKNVTNFKIGDAVFGSKADGGAYAEFIVATPDIISLKPDSLSFIEAASVPMVAETAFMALFKYGHLIAGQTILIHGGAGAVGSYAVQLASQSGAKVIVTADENDKEYLLTLGANQIIDYKSQKFELLIDKVDLVLDLIGGEVQERSFAILKKGGYLVATNQLPSVDLANKYEINAVFMHAKPSFSSLNQISKLIDSGKLKINIAETYDLCNVDHAWHNLALNIGKNVQSEFKKADKRHGKHVLKV